MKAFVTHFSTYLMLLISLAAISLAIVSSQVSHMKSPNPCFSNQQGTVYPVAGKCTSYIYCQQGLPIELPCQVGDGFSNSAKGCVNINVSDCALMSITTSTEAPTTATTTTTTTTTTESTTVTTTTPFVGCDTNERRLANRAQCTGKPMGSIEPYPGDCSKFLLCDCEYPTVVPCPGGLWFNPKTRGCNSPQNVDCPWTTTALTTLTTEAVRISDSTKEHSIFSTGTTSYGPTSSTVSSTEGSSVPSEGTTAGSTASQSSSTERSSIPIDRTTPDKTESSSTSTIGNSAPIDGTTPEITNSSTEGSTVPNGGTTPDSTASSSTSTDGSAVPIDGTTADSTSSSTTSTEGSSVPSDRTTPDSTESSSASTKGSSTPIDGTTPEITNSSTEKSSVPIGGTTLDNTTSSSTSTNGSSEPIGATTLDSTTSSSTSTDGSAVPIDGTTLDSTTSSSTSTERISMPSDGSTTSFATQDPPGTTDPPALTSSTQSGTPNTKITTGPAVCMNTQPPPGINRNFCVSLTAKQLEKGLQPYNYDCSAYINCATGCPVLEYCPTDRIFNPQLAICDTLGSVDCIDEPLSTTVTTPTSTTLPPDIPSGICLNRPSNALIPYADNCAQYIFCQNGVPSIYSCPKGFLFDPQLLLCNDAQDVTCSGDVTTASPIKNLCTGVAKGTSFPYPSDCSMYYYCNGKNDTPQVLSCSKNNWYSSETESCGPKNSPDACHTTTTTPLPAVHRICNDVTDGQIISYPNNCRKYITCVLPAPIAFDCPSNMGFNPKSLECQVPTDDSCKLEPNKTTTSPLPNICNGVPVNGTIRYPENCQFYIRCYESSYMLESCNMGEYYDPTISRCSADVSSEACNSSPTLTTTDINPSTMTTSTPIDTKACDDEPAGYMVPYPNSCIKYITCNSPLSIAHECSDGLEFNVKQQTCTDPESAKCSVPISSITTTKSGESTLSSDETTSSAETTPPSTTNIEEITTSASTLSSSETRTTYNGETTTQSLHPSTSISTTISFSTTIVAPFSCSGLPNKTILPDPTDCSRYIVCNNERPAVVKCLPGTFFNPVSELCDSSTSSTACREGNTTSSTEISVSDTTSTPPHTSQVTDTSTVEKTPNTDSTSETGTTQVITGTSNHAVTPSLTQLCQGEPEGAMIPYPHDCSKFITCNLPNPSVNSCPEGLDFSAVKYGCVDAADSECAESGSTSTPSMESTSPRTITTTADTLLTTDISETTSSTKVTETSATSSETTTPSTTLLCHGQTEGALIPYPYDCSKYISCDFPIPSTHSCPRGLQFSGDILACVEPVESGCIAGETGSTTARPPITVSPNNGNICCDKPLGTQLPYPNDNHKFVICQYPVPIIYSCPSSTTYDAEKEQCLFQNKTRDNTTEEVNNLSTTSDPPQSLSTESFDPKTSTIDPPNQTTKDPPPLSTYTSDPTQDPPTETTISSSTFIYPTYPSNDATSVCKGQKAGSQFPYIGDCRKYNFCFANGGIVLECGSGWYFNPSTKMCVSPSNYHCPWH